MRCWAIEIELGGRTYDVPALPAVDWWPVLVNRDLAAILDFVESSPDDPFNLDDLLLTGELTGNLGEALTDAIEAAAGRSLHCAFVIATVADMHWAAIGGALAQAGFRWDVQPLGAALDAIYTTVVSMLDKEALEKFVALLEDETATQPGKKRKPPERVVNEFESLAGPRPTSGVKATAEQSGNSRPRTQPRPRPLRQPGRSGAPRRLRGERAGSDPGASS